MMREDSRVVKDVALSIRRDHLKATRNLPGSLFKLEYHRVDLIEHRPHMAHGRADDENNNTVKAIGKLNTLSLLSARWRLAFNLNPDTSL